MPEKFTLASIFVNHDLEKSLLAAIIAKPEIYWEIFDYLPPNALVGAKQEFEAIAEAIEKEQPLPSLTIEAPPTSDPQTSAKQLAELYQKRIMADVLQNSLENLRGESSIQELATELENNLTRIQQAVQELRTGQTLAWAEIFPNVLKDITAKREAVKQGLKTVGLPTGIAKLDKLLGGLQPGVHLLAAEPGKGKTTLALQIAQNIAKEGYPALFVSFEEPLPRLSLKALCQIALLEIKPFADGYGEPSELEKAARIHGNNLQNLYFLEGNKRVTVSQIKAKALQIMTKKKTKKCVVVLDYIQKMAASNREFADYRHVVASLVSDLRELSMRLDCPVVAISSQNRGGQGQAKLTSFKESGDLEYSADTAMFLIESLERRATPPHRAVDLIIEKNRYGDKGKICLIFKPTTGSFVEEAKV